MSPSILTLPLRLTPVCAVLLGGCIAVELVMLLAGPGLEARLLNGLGLVPGVLTGALALRQDWQLVPAWVTLVTALFLHGSLLHLLGNMLFLWAVGRPLELVLGPWRLGLLYGLSGIAGGLLETLLSPGSPMPVIGASGAISGLFAAYLMLFARPRPGDEGKSTARRAIGYLAFWLLLQAGMVVALEPGMGSGGIAVWAHVGGFVAGLVIIAVIAPRR